MIMWFKIALRNLIKNRRRSIITAFAIAFGFAGVNLFSGFTEYMYTGNREAAIFIKSRGHLNVFKTGFLDKGRLNPERYLLTPEEIHTIEEVCAKNPRVVLVTPQLVISGLLTNGKVSTIFVAQGIIPSSEQDLLSRMTMADVEMIEGKFEGKHMTDDEMYGVSLSRGLANLLDLDVGSYGVAFTNTTEGQMNALDIEVFQLFDAGQELMKDKVMRVPLQFAQTLYDWNGADRISVLLKSHADTEPVRDQLQKAFSESGLDVDVKTWEEMSEWYQKVKEMFDIIFLFLFIIVFFIVVMSVVNTMSMAVFERTREIGTLRALGLKRKGVLMLFGLESSLLGIWGAFGGLILTAIGWWAVNFFEPTWVPPGMVSRLPIIIKFVPKTMAWSFIFLMAFCLGASLIPARRAARQNTVDALGHV